MSGCLFWHVTSYIIFYLHFTFTGVYGWPSGTYSLPRPEDGCPENAEWLIGSRCQMTEEGSHASPGNHLDALQNEGTDSIVQSFCTNADSTTYDYEWMPGQYCIFKKGACPTNFDEGWVYWDDAASFIGPTKQDKSGILPDGQYDRNTKIYYCCRHDGFAENPIRLPTSSPFYLLKWGPLCQRVQSMSATEEWLYWADEKSVNMNARGGVYPTMTRLAYPKKFTKIYYCYYEPEQRKSHRSTMMTILYVVIALTAVALVTCCVTWILRRLFTRLQPADLTEESDEHMLPASQPPVVMRHASPHKTPSAPPYGDDERPPSYDTVMRQDMMR